MNNPWRIIFKEYLNKSPESEGWRPGCPLGCFIKLARLPFVKETLGSSVLLVTQRDFVIFKVTPPSAFGESLNIKFILCCNFQTLLKKKKEKKKSMFYFCNLSINIDYMPI